MASLQAMFPHMEEGSQASDWILFERRRANLPQPKQHGTLMVMNFKLQQGMPAMDLGATNMFDVLSSPGLFMTEIFEDGYSLGSGWVFTGSRPTSSGLSFLGSSGSIVRTRFMTFESENHANILLSFKASPDIVVFSHVRELDGRTNLTSHGIIQLRTRTAMALASGVDLRNCMSCAQRGQLCMCDSADISELCESWRLHRRLSFRSAPGLQGLFSNKYTRSWLEGSWSVAVEHSKPFSLGIECAIEGPVFDCALLDVLQNEVLQMMPPKPWLEFSDSSQRQQLLAPRPPDEIPGGAPVFPDGRPSKMSALLEAAADDFNRVQISWDAESVHSSRAVSHNNSPAVSDCTYSHENNVSTPPRRRCCGTTAAKAGGAADAAEHSEGLVDARAATTAMVESMLHKFSSPTSSPTRANVKLRRTDDATVVYINGRRTLRCPQCESFFRRRYDLKRHVASVHCKRKDFRCPGCAKSFSQSGHLNEHIRIEHGDGALSCEMCSKKFGAFSKLQRHVRTVHQNLRIFNCAHCGCTYKEKSYLKQHCLNKHGVPC